MTEPLEGAGAKQSRLNRESMSKIFGNLDPNCQVIFISTDVTGATPTHIHMQGPSKDGVLIGGMIAEAGRTIFSSLDNDKKAIVIKIKELESRVDILENKDQA